MVETNVMLWLIFSSNFLDIWQASDQAHIT